MFKKRQNGQHYLQWPDQTAYTRGRVLGKGGFGKCYELIHPTTRDRFACKIIDKQTIQSQIVKEKLQSQIAIHRLLKNQNIVKFQAWHQDEHFIYILLQLCGNNSLCDLIQRRKAVVQVEARYYLKQLLQALSYLHQKQIVHRDLKLQNCFINEQMELKLGDFGLAVSLGTQKRRKSVCGTTNYMAPQITTPQGYSNEVDIWSLGILTYLLLCGRFPFQGKDNKMIAMQCKTGSYLRGTPLSETAKALLKTMLQFDPIQRITARKLLSHQFFTAYDIPQRLPVSCMACAPLSSFLQQYRDRRKDISESYEFHFMLQSRQEMIQKPNQEQIFKSAVKEKKQQQKNNYFISAKKVLSQGYNDNKQIDWIQQWWQFPKYGLLYLSTDGSVGMRFNDGSFLKTLNYPSKWIYRSKSKPEVIDISKTQAEIPSLISLKIQIAKKVINQSNLNQKIIVTSTEGLYVKLYYNCLQMFLIWLDDGSIQASFQDHTTFIIHKEKQIFVTPQMYMQLSQSDFKEKPQIKQKFSQIRSVIKRISKAGQSLTDLGKQNIIG